MNVICGPDIVAQEREPERTSWCFRCRHVTDHYLVVSYPERGSYYEPSADAILLVNAPNDQRCEDLAASLDETRAALDIASRKEDQ